MKSKHNFSMVEVLLALGVVAIGVCSIMVLFPVGASASRDASMETYAANAADQMLHYIRYRLDEEGKWNEIIGNSDTTGEITEGTGTALSTEDLLDNDKWEKCSYGENVYQHKTQKNIYQLIAHRAPTGKQPGTSWNEGGTTITFEERIDFRGIITLTKNKISVGEHEIPYTIGASLSAKLQWPAELPAAARQNAHYVLEVYKTK